MRGLKYLSEVSHSFQPGVVSEVLAHNAFLRADKEFISRHGADWIQEIDLYEDSMRTELERLAATLGEAFSLLDAADELIPQYEACLDHHPEFSPAPWKAWYLGTKENAGFELLQERIERVLIANMFPSAIGAACAALPDQEGPANEVQWARGWLSNLEKERSANAKKLLPMAPETCLAYARLGEMEALGRWLERLTDPSDPGAFDPLHAQFAEWQLRQGNTQEALNHIAAINSPSLSDPLYAALSLYWLKDQPIKSGEVLLMIESSKIRCETGMKLASDEGFTKSPENIHRLIAAVGDSASSLADIIKVLGNRADSALFKELSESLQLAENDFKARYVGRLESLLKNAMVERKPLG